MHENWYNFFFWLLISNLFYFSLFRVRSSIRRRFNLFHKHFHFIVLSFSHCVWLEYIYKIQNTFIINHNIGDVHHFPWRDCQFHTFSFKWFFKFCWIFGGWRIGLLVSYSKPKSMQLIWNNRHLYTKNCSITISNSKYYWILGCVNIGFYRIIRGVECIFSLSNRISAK